MMPNRRHPMFAMLMAVALAGLSGCSGTGSGVRGFRGFENWRLPPRTGGLKEDLSRLEYQNERLQEELKTVQSEKNRLASELELANIDKQQLQANLQNYRERLGYLNARMDERGAARGFGGDNDPGSATRNAAGSDAGWPPATRIPNRSARIEVNTPPGRSSGDSGGSGADWNIEPDFNPESARDSAWDEPGAMNPEIAYPPVEYFSVSPSSDRRPSSRQARVRVEPPRSVTLAPSRANRAPHSGSASTQRSNRSANASAWSPVAQSLATWGRTSRRR